MLPSPDILNVYEHGKFVLSNLAAKRARQLREGAMPLVQIDSHHPLTIALAEIAAGKIKPILSEHAESIELDGADLALITDEPLPAELGMLLPALDETEVALVTSIVEDHEHDIEGDVDGDGETPISLSDLVEDEADAEVEDEAPAASDDDTLSLSDIADQEAQEEEEAES